MALKKKSIFSWRKKTKIQNSNSETKSLLPGNGNKATKSKKLLKTLCNDIKTLLEKSKKEETKIGNTNSIAKDDQELPSETFFSELMNKRHYYEACKAISSLEETNAANAHTMYQKVITHMWMTVQMVLKGDSSLSVHIKSVTDCLKWAEEKSLSHLGEWSPESWNEKFAELILDHIREQLFTFEGNTSVKKDLKKHLEKLERNVLGNIERNRSLLGDLFIHYLTCVSACMLNHLSLLEINDLNYEECLLIYRLGCREHWRRCFCMKTCGKFNHLLFITWLQSSGTKINTHVANEVFPIGVSNVDTSRDDDDDDDDGVYWIEFLYFLKRYNSILQEKLEKMLSLKEICPSLWIIRNCQILKDTLENKINIPEAKSARCLEIMKVINQNEEHGITLLAEALKTEMKEPFQEYFTKNNNEFLKIICEFQCSLKCALIKNNEKLVKTIYYRIVGLYMESFLKYSNKIRHSSKAEVFSAGSTPLQDFFTNLLPYKVEFKDPMEKLLHLMTSQDTESLQATVCFLCNDHQGLRKAHLRAILNLNGNISRKEKEKLMYYIKTRKTVPSEDEICPFQDMEVRRCCLWWCFTCWD